MISFAARRVPTRSQQLSGVPDGPNETWTDHELMCAVQHDNEAAFELLVRRHQRIILRIADRFLGDSTTARDVSQEVFLSLWATRQRYKSNGKIRNLLITMTINRCQNLVRHKKVRNEKSPEIERQYTERWSECRSPDRHVLATESAEIVQRKLAQLPDNIRETLILRFAGDMALHDIAAALNIPLGTVKSNLSRGLKRLHGLFAQEQT